MPRKNRLTGAEIRRLKPGKRLISSLFSLSVSPRASGTGVACVVSKKVSGKAVMRNTLKRRMRMAIRAAGALPQGALVLTAKKSALSVPYDAIRDDIAELISRVRSGR